MAGRVHSNGTGRALCLVHNAWPFRDPSGQRPSNTKPVSSTARCHRSPHTPTGWERFGSVADANFSNFPAERENWLSRCRGERAVALKNRPKAEATSSPMKRGLLNRVQADLIHHAKGLDLHFENTHPGAVGVFYCRATALRPGNFFPDPDHVTRPFLPPFLWKC